MGLGCRTPQGRRRPGIERLRIFIAGTSFDPAYGGPAYSVARMAMALADAGIDVGLWAPDQSASSSQLLAPASPVRRLTGAASEALREFGKADIIHDNGIWLRHNHRLARHALATRVPRVVSTRGMLEPWAMSHKRMKKRVAWAWYQRRDLASARLHHATSDVEAKHLHELALGVPVHVISNGVDIPPMGDKAETRPVRDRAHGKRIALFLGRLYPVKGLPMLVEAWARVRPEGWCLQIAGPDEAGHRSVVERTIAVAGLGEVISFAGPLAGEAKRGAFLNADLFVLPTHSESFGMSVAEALAHALPVLTTTAAPWRALAEHGCGWWVEPSVEGLAEGLCKATAEESETLRSMGARGRHMVSLSYGWDCVTRQLITMYEEMA